MANYFRNENFKFLKTQKKLIKYNGKFLNTVILIKILKAVFL